MVVLATTLLVDNNRGIFWGALLIMRGGQSQNFEGPSLVAFGYYWMQLVTTHLINDNRNLKFEVY